MLFHVSIVACLILMLLHDTYLMSRRHSWWLNNTLLVRFPINALAAILPKKQYFQWLHQAFRVFLVVLTTQMIRKRAMAIGIHSRLAS